MIRFKSLSVLLAVGMVGGVYASGSDVQVDPVDMTGVSADSTPIAPAPDISKNVAKGRRRGERRSGRDSPIPGNRRDRRHAGGSRSQHGEHDGDRSGE